MLAMDMPHAGIRNWKFIERVEIERAILGCIVDIDPAGLDEFATTNIKQEIGLVPAKLLEAPSMADLTVDMSSKINERAARQLRPALSARRKIFADEESQGFHKVPCNAALMLLSAIWLLLSAI